MKILIVLTSHDQLGQTGRKTGFWLEELAAPYFVFKDAGAEVILTSPKGGQPPLDPKSNEPDFQTDATRRFEADMNANVALANTKKLAAVEQSDFDAVFYPGGHGPLWDLAEDKNSIDLISSTLSHNKPVALVCHAPGVLRHVKNVDGSPLVSGRKVTGFTNSEEDAVELTHIVPFLVEDELIKNNGIYSKGPDWQSYVVQDGLLITGQNPASSEEAARGLVANFGNVEKIMSAYVVMLRENTKDLAEMSLYEKEAPLARSGHDITPLVKYGALKVLEGSSFEGCLIHRFPSVEAAEAWYQSPKYHAAMKHRHKGANYRVFIVEGVGD